MSENHKPNTPRPKPSNPNNGSETRSIGNPKPSRSTANPPKPK